MLARSPFRAIDVQPRPADALVGSSSTKVAPLPGPGLEAVSVPPITAAEQALLCSPSHLDTEAKELHT